MGKKVESFFNIEIKARCRNPAHVRSVLRKLEAGYKGTDHQIDTYFKINNGRLKLRQGKIENNLVYYQRENKKGPKQADVMLFVVSGKIKDVLAKSLGILCIVDKKREIYFIGNVKFHIDKVKKLGNFVEIESKSGKMSRNAMLKQVSRYMKLFGVRNQDLVTHSYSDLIMRTNK